MTISTILVVESEPEVGRVLRATLSPDQYVILEMQTGERALDFMQETHPDLVVLDISLQGMDGLETCRRIRISCGIPIIVVGAHRSHRDTVLALDLGADDFLIKPFQRDELLARIRACFRRSSQDNGVSAFTTPDMTINFECRDIVVRGRPIHLTPKAFDILRYLIANHGRPVSFQTLCHIVWGLDSIARITSLRVGIQELRKKIEIDPANPKYILTESRVGYRFQCQPDCGRALCPDVVTRSTAVRTV